MSCPLTFFWHRRDLRTHDNAGLFHALQSGYEVLPLFIFDREILEVLPPADRRVHFIHQEIERLQTRYRAAGTCLIVRYGRPMEVWKQLCEDYRIEQVHTNRDYEPYAKARDAALEKMLQERGIDFFQHKDSVLRHHEEVRTPAEGKVYKVFTPFKNRWLQTLTEEHLQAFDTENHLGHLRQTTETEPIPTLEAMGFDAKAQDTFVFPNTCVSDLLLQQYADKRDRPDLDATSRLGLHLRFGTVSIREVAVRAREHSAVFLSELIWRDFYSQILDAYPHIPERAFKLEYDRIPWRKDAAADADFERWCAGQTGYPLVDAGMRQLIETGFMHNRVRMVVASFLTKHLLIDWRRGERWFARWLLDFDLASNVGGWQWAAGTGVDAAPYFRIFNPSEQARKFDPDHRYIRRWVPEFEGLGYPPPMIDHKFARERALSTYKQALG